MCRIGCGGVPMRVYNRAIGNASWNTLEEYVETPTAVLYGAGAESFSDYPMVAGHWLSNLTPPAAGQMLYLDAFGVRVGGDFDGAGVPKRVPSCLELGIEYPIIFQPGNDFEIMPMMIGVIPIACAIVCAGAAVCLGACLRACGGWNLHCIFRCMWNSLICRITGIACLACIVYYGWRLLVRWCPNIRTYIIQCGEEYGIGRPDKFIFCVIRLCLGIPRLPKPSSVTSVL